LYIQSLNNNTVPFEIEKLTDTQRLNEYIMTSLRTMEGLNVQYVANRFGETMSSKLQQISKQFIETGKLKNYNGHLQLTKEGKLFADGIASALFV
jgi:oxygen-independent coproporphyrinogen-3 oxidase